MTLLRDGTTAVAGSVTYDAATNRVTFAPSSALALSTAYTLRLAASISAADGTLLGATTDVPFTTSATPPPVPTATAVTPDTGSTGFARDGAPTAVFSVPMDPATITSSTFTLTPAGPLGLPVAATVSYAATTRTATITPNSLLQAGVVYTARLTTGVRSDDGVPLANDQTWTFTTAECPCTLFPDSLTPASAANPVQDGRGGAGPFTYEMGVKVATTASAEVRGVRFYKSPGETGTHIGRIWSSGGTLLGQVTFTGETASGWQTQQLASPLTLANNQAYVISVNRNNFYPLTTGGLASQIIAGPVSSFVGANGVFADTAGTFPTGSWNSSNYFVDLVVARAPTPTPTVTATTPADNATNVAIDASPTATFSGAMDPSTLTTASVTLRPQGGAPVPAIVSYDASNNRVTLNPAVDLATSTTYTAQVSTAAASPRLAARRPRDLELHHVQHRAGRGHALPAVPRHDDPRLRREPGAGRPLRRRPVHLRDGRQGDGHLGRRDPRGALLQERRRDRHPHRPRLELGRHPARPGDLHRRERLGLADPAAREPASDGHGQVYVISVNRNNFYAVTTTGLAAPVTAGPVTSVVGSNGVYADSAGTFPTSSWRDSNYLVDLVVARGVLPPTVTAKTPADNATSVATDVSPRVTFSRAMDPSTLTAASVTLSPQGGSPVPATITYDAPNNRVTLNPITDLTPNTTYTAQVTAAATSADGVPLAAPVTWSFTTSAQCPCTLFPDTMTPVSDANVVQDGRIGPGPFSYEMGVQVTANGAAEIRGVRFYKSPGETGTHIGRIWTSGGTQLAQVTFSGETASGWQTQLLDTPVSMTPMDRRT